MRGVAQNITALSFLGWLCILHFGPNSRGYPFHLNESTVPNLCSFADIYPFFRFSYNKDPYTFQLTFLATLAIWVGRGLSPVHNSRSYLIVQAIEIINSFIARQLMYRMTKMDVTQLGLNEMKEYPELSRCLRCCIPEWTLMSNVSVLIAVAMGRYQPGALSVPRVFSANPCVVTRRLGQRPYPQQHPPLPDQGALNPIPTSARSYADRLPLTLRSSTSSKHTRNDTLY